MLTSTLRLKEKSGADQAMQKNVSNKNIVIEVN